MNAGESNACYYDHSNTEAKESADAQLLTRFHSYLPYDARGNADDCNGYEPGHLGSLQGCADILRISVNIYRPIPTSIIADALSKPLLLRHFTALYVSPAELQKLVGDLPTCCNIRMRTLQENITNTISERNYINQNHNPPMQEEPRQTIYQLVKQRQEGELHRKED